MFTTIDKALTALIMGAVSLAQMMFGWDLSGIGVTADMLTMFINVVLYPAIVWLIPNREPE